MSCLFALVLMVTDPAPLLGGPEDEPVHKPQGAVVYEAQSYRAEGSYERYRHERAHTRWGPDTVSARPTRPVQAGDPVRLDEGFFYGPLTGGVEQAPPRIIVTRYPAYYSRSNQRSY